MPRRTEEEVSAAGAEAYRGALVGAAKVEAPSSPIRNSPLLIYSTNCSPILGLLTPLHFQWGLIAGGLGAVGYFVSPIYRGLTVQFKVYVHVPYNVPPHSKSTRYDLTPVCTQVHPAIRHDIRGLD